MFSCLISICWISSKTETVWSTADLFMGLMAIVNLISIIGLSNIAIAVMKDYQKQRKAGMKPVFKPEILKLTYLVLKLGVENQLPKNNHLSD